MWDYNWGVRDYNLRLQVKNVGLQVQVELLLVQIDCRQVENGSPQLESKGGIDPLGRQSVGNLVHYIVLEAKLKGITHYH